MAFTKDPIFLSFLAGADLTTASQYRFVKFDSSGNVVRCSGATDKPVGILQNEPDEGQTAEVQVAGVSKLHTLVDLDAGDIIATSTAGNGQEAVSTQYPMGLVVDGTTASGICSVLLAQCYNAI
jgi:hypothetical protein